MNLVLYSNKMDEYLKHEDVITCTASEVLKAGHGICFPKSHLLAALLRCKSVPAGFCYQKLILDDETAPILIYHGLNGVYVKEYKNGSDLMQEGIKLVLTQNFHWKRNSLRSQYVRKWEKKIALSYILTLI